MPLLIYLFWGLVNLQWVVMMTSQTQHVQNGFLTFTFLITTQGLYHPTIIMHGDINYYRK
jgi:hypothetical protein